jgi:RNA polymerase-binding transcription factor DksA
VNDTTAILQRELEDLKSQIIILERTLEEKPDCGLGKGAPAVTQWELDQAMAGQLKKRAASIERMLSRTGKERYGICQQCGKTIHPDRLAVLPGTRICIQCARVEEHK